QVHHRAKPRAHPPRARPRILPELRGLVLRGPRASRPPLVILSAAKDLMPVASGDEVLRCAQETTDMSGRDARGPRKTSDLAVMLPDLRRALRSAGALA